MYKPSYDQQDNSASLLYGSRAKAAPGISVSIIGNNLGKLK